MSGTRWTVGILGIWVALTAFLDLGLTANFWSDLIVGVAVAIAALSIGAESKWEGWTVGLLGLWLAIAAFIPGLRDGTGLLWNNLIVGIGIALPAFLPQPAESSRHAHHHA